MNYWGGRWGHHPDSMTGRFEAEQSERRMAGIEAVMEQRRRAHRQRAAAEAASLASPIAVVVDRALAALAEEIKPGDAVPRSAEMLALMNCEHECHRNASTTAVVCPGCGWTTGGPAQTGPAQTEQGANQ